MLFSSLCKFESEQLLLVNSLWSTSSRPVLELEMVFRSVPCFVCVYRFVSGRLLTFASESWSVSPKKRRFFAGDVRGFVCFVQDLRGDSSSVVITLSFSIWGIEKLDKSREHDSDLICFKQYILIMDNNLVPCSSAKVTNNVQLEFLFHYQNSVIHLISVFEYNVIIPQCFSPSFQLVYRGT